MPFSDATPDGAPTPDDAAEPTSGFAPLLAFGAHPDDVEFGCGGVLALEARRGRPVYCVVCSRGESASHGTPAERTAEAEDAASLLGTTLEWLDLGGDAHFEPRVSHALALAAIIRRVRPALVLAPTRAENQHPDHLVLARLVRDAARLARYGGVAELRAQPAHAIGTLLGYAITAEAEPAGVAPVLIDVSDPEVAETWRTAMEAHATQLRTRGYVDLQLTRAQLWGQRAGVALACALFPDEPLVFSSVEGLTRSARRY